MKSLDHRELQEEAARMIPQSILYESENPFKRYIHNKRREIILRFAQGKRLVLDVGCGDGFFLEKLDDALGIELSVIRARRAKKRSGKPVIVGTAEKIPLKSHSFDGVIISEVLEHLINPGQCLAEIVRVMKKEGLAIISIPNDNVLGIGGQLAHMLEIMFGKVSSKMKYKRFSIHEHISQISPEDLRTFFELKKRSNVLFNLPFKLAFFHVGLYNLREKENKNA